MLIEDIVKESQNTTKVSFISSGLFCNVYNESAYIATELLGLRLKLRVITVKKLNNQKVIVGGLPQHMLLKQFSGVVKTAWGFELEGYFETRGYGAWLARAVADAADNGEHVPAQTAAKFTKQPIEKNHLNNQYNYQFNPKDNPDLYCLYVPLTREQLDYLLVWQEDCSSTLESKASMQNFMTDLRHQAILQCVNKTINTNQ